MAKRPFFDTTVLGYADDADAGKKKARAESLLKEHFTRAVISTQVLQEYYAIATRKMRVPPEIARDKVVRFAAMELVTVNVELILAAIDLQRIQSISFWDALIAKAASAAGCDRLFSEDLQDGAKIDGVTIENPFHAID